MMFRNVRFKNRALGSPKIAPLYYEVRRLKTMIITASAIAQLVAGGFFIVNTLGNEASEYISGVINVFVLLNKQFYDKERKKGNVSYSKRFANRSCSW